MEDQNAVNEVLNYIISEIEFANLNGPRVILEEPKQESVSCCLSSLTGTVTEDGIVAEVMEETLSKVQEEMQHTAANVETTSTFQNDAILKNTSRFGFTDGKLSCTKVASTNSSQRKIQFSNFFQRSKRKACFSSFSEYDRFGLFNKKICLDQTFNKNTKSRNLMFSVESPLFIFQSKFLNPYQNQANQILKQKSNTQLQDVPPKQLETKHTPRKPCTNLMPQATQALVTKSSYSIVNSLAAAVNFSITPEVVSMLGHLLVPTESLQIQLLNQTPTYVTDVKPISNIQSLKNGNLQKEEKATDVEPVSNTRPSKIENLQKEETSTNVKPISNTRPSKIENLKTGELPTDVKPISNTRPDKIENLQTEGIATGVKPSTVETSISHKIPEKAEDHKWLSFVSNIKAISTITTEVQDDFIKVNDNKPSQLSLYDAGNITDNFIVKNDKPSQLSLYNPGKIPDEVIKGNADKPKVSLSNTGLLRDDFTKVDIDKTSQVLYDAGNQEVPSANPIYSNESSVFNSYDSLEKLQLFPELDMKSNTALTANHTNQPQEPIINISSGQLVQRDVKLGSKELSWNPWTWKKLESIKEKCIRSHESCEVPQSEAENIENVERVEYFQEQCVTDAVVPQFEKEPNQDDEHYVNITSPQSCNLTHDVPDILVQSNHNFDQDPTVECSPVLFEDMSLEDNSSESILPTPSKSPVFPIAQDDEKSQDSSNYLRNTQEIFETLTQHATALETETLNLDDKLPEQQMLEEVSILIPPTQFKDLDQEVPSCIEDLDDYIVPPAMYVPAADDKESSDDDSSQEEVADGLLNYDVGFSMRKPMTEAPARLSRVQPLVTCNRPRRIGLSRNQRVPSLHLLNNY